MEKFIRSSLINIVKWTPSGAAIGVMLHSVLTQEWTQAFVASFVAASSLFWASFSGKFMEEAEKEAEKRGGGLAKWLFMVSDMVSAHTARGVAHSWQYLTSDFEDKYYQRLTYICRDYETQGLNKDQVLKLHQVFIPLKISTQNLNKISQNLIQNSSTDLSKRQDIGQFLIRMRSDPAFRRLAILGAPGSGKTTLLRHLTLIYTSRQERKFLHPKMPRFVPVLIYLRDVVEIIVTTPQLSLVDFLNIWVQRLQSIDSLKPPPDWFAKQLNRKRCLILLDGLDEISESYRQAVSQWIDFQMKAYPETAFILTSRPLGYKDAQLRQDMTVLEVQPFSLKQVTQFIHNWYLETEITSHYNDDSGVQEEAKQQADDLVRRIQDSVPLTAMAVNPLLLTMIAVVHRRGSPLPGRRGDLYKEICHILLDTRQRAKGLQDVLTGTQKQSVLQLLALGLMQAKTRSFTLSSNVDKLLQSRLALVTRKPPTSEGFLEQMRKVSGILSIREEGVYQFAHLGFQEYLAAAEIAETSKESLLNVFADREDTSWWSETIRLYAAQSDASRIIRAAIQASTTESLSLALDCLQEARSVDPAVRQKLENIIAEGLEERVVKAKNLELTKHISIELVGTSGFFKGEKGTLLLEARNSGKNKLNFLFSIENTASYEIRKNEARTIGLEPGKSIVLDYEIFTIALGTILLQIKLDKKVYEKPLKIISAYDNPYFYGPPVKDAINFFGRDQEIQVLWNNVVGTIGAHTLLIGEQRSGKTSLLYQLKNHLSPPYIVIYIPLLDMDKKSESALSKLLMQILDALEEQGIPKMAGVNTSLQYGMRFIKEFENILKNIKSKIADAKLVLLLDEAHLMNRIDVGFQEVLRETFSKFTSDIRVVMACYYDFFEELDASGSPLHNIFEHLFLNPLEERASNQLITEPARKYGYEYDNEAQTRIIEIAGGHPYYCQFICAKSFIRAKSKDSKKISTSHVQLAYQEVIKADKEKFKAGYWNRLSEEECLLLQKMVRKNIRQDASREVIEKLISKSIIVKSNGNYVFTSKLFESWIREIIDGKFYS
ncbi:MAG: NACHT domain-containing protein [Cyanobacteria bacterium P01_H01_bin.105]